MYTEEEKREMPGTLLFTSGKLAYTDSQIFRLYKRKTGVYFCFTNIVTKNPVKGLFRNTVSEQKCSLDSEKEKGNPRCSDFWE